MMQKLLKIKDENTLLRDENTKAILVTDTVGLQHYKNSRSIKQAAAQEQKNIIAEQAVIKQELSEIKSLLMKLLEKPNDI